MCCIMRIVCIRYTTAALLKVGGQRSAGAARKGKHVEAHRGFEARVNSQLECACVARRCRPPHLLPHSSILSVQDNMLGSLILYYQRYFYVILHCSLHIELCKTITYSMSLLRTVYEMKPVMNIHKIQIFIFVNSNKHSFWFISFSSYNMSL